MKKATAILSMIVISVLLISSPLSAQKGNMNGMKGNKNMMYSNYQKNSFQNIPNITDEQKTQLKTKRTAMMKEALPLRNSLKEKMARLNTLSSATEPNMKAINKQIESIGEDKVAIMKIRANFRQEVRKVLTEDQRVYFDMHSGMMQKNKGHHHGMKMKQGAYK
ncbi:MAG: hypothetical protein DRI86_15180 [Bacteroidetes bacterium]|nr:MAG: hypothetical protein DRI86_15180 [Bacteroidota bacterium]